MSKTLVLWFFLFSVLMYSACGSTCSAKTGEFKTKRQKEPKPTYPTTMIMESSKPCIPGTFQELHAAPQTKISRIGKAIYRGPSNLSSRKVRHGSNSYSVKPSSLFMVALRHLVLGLLLVPCFF